MSFKQSVRWVIALKHEARCIIKNFQLTLVAYEERFQIFKNKTETHWLIISGIGEINSKEAVKCLHKLSGSEVNSIWINVGIAGYYKNFGEMFLIDKIRTNNSKSKFYPSSVISSNLPRQSLLTLSKPSQKYAEKNLFDMEGFSFYQEVEKITYRELIAVIKIVSDDQDNSIRKISGSNVEKLINNNFSKIKNILDKLINFLSILYEENKETNAFNEICNKHSFTFTQKSQLKLLLQRWEALFPEKNLMKEITSFDDSKSIIKYLNSSFEQFEIQW